MSGPMPYYLEKGPALEVLEDFLNTPGARLNTAVDMMRLKDSAGNYVHPLVDTGAFDASSLRFTQPANQTPNNKSKNWDTAAWRQHMDEHWFGRKDPSGNVVDPKANLGTPKSWWINYAGENVQDIVREAILLGLETAYGVPHGGALVSTPHDPWPIELFWKCGQPWFEGWVTWRKLPGAGARGVVTIMFCTPAENSGKHVVWESPVPTTHDGKDDGPPYPLGVGQLGQEQSGMVVVTHTDNLPQGTVSAQIPGQQQGTLVPPPPGAIFHGVGPVVAVRPSEVRGGAGTAARVWVP